MELTVSIDDSLAESTKNYAVSRAVSLDQAVEELLRQGLHEPEIRVVDGFAEFILPQGVPTLTTETLLRCEDEF